MSLTLLASPWIIGASIGFLLTSNFRENGGYQLINAGIGGIFGWLTLTGVIRLSLFINKNLLLSYLTFALSIGTYVCMFAVILHLARSQRASKYSLKNKSSCFPFFLLASTLAAGVLQVLELPIFSWDALTGDLFWDLLSDGWRNRPGYSARAGHLISQYTGPDIVGDGIVHRHSVTNILILSWSGWISFMSGASTSGAPWLLMLISCIFITTGYSLTVTSSATTSIFCGWVVATMPLLENHALLAGYNEMLIAMLLMCSCVLIAIGLQLTDTTYLILGALSSLSLLATKSTGPIYLIPVWLTLVLVVLHNYSIRIFLSTVMLLVTLAAAILYLGLDLQLWSQKISWLPGENSLEIAGRKLEIVRPNLSHLWANYITAFHLNTSFSLAGILASISPGVLACLFYKRGELPDSALFLIAVSFLSTTIFCFSMLTDYGLAHSGPSTDRQFSRSLLPVICLSILCLPHIISLSGITTEKSHSCRKNNGARS